MSEEAPRPPEWSKPAPLGYGAAADAAHFVAAPLLAAGDLAFIGVVSADPERFRAPALVLLLLALAVIALIGSVQYGFHARILLYSAADVEAWWGEEDFQSRRDWLRTAQKLHYSRWKSTIARAVTCYNIGITLLGAGVAAGLMPVGASRGADEWIRWLATGIVGAAAIAELTWTVLSPQWPFKAVS